MDALRMQMEMLKCDMHGESNYDSWFFKLNLALRTKGLIEYANDTKVKPSGADTLPAVEEWIKKDLEAQALIGLNVEGQIARKISSCSSSQQMLQKLETLYGKKSNLSIEGLQRLFINYKYDESISVLQNCMLIQQYTDDLAAQGETVKESWIMARILSILPPRLHHFRTAWDNVQATDKNLTTMIERLKLEDDRQKGSEQQVEHQTAFVARSSQNKNSKKPSKSLANVQCYKCEQKGHFAKGCNNTPCEKYKEYCKKNYTCNKCHKKGHFAKECPMNDNQKSNCNHKSTKAMICTSLTARNMKYISAKSNSKDLWYQDCGATQHMSCNKEWLKNYKPLESPELVLIGNSTFIKGYGVGEFEFWAWNDEAWSKRILKKVLYTPEIPFNLFSVTSALDNGYVQKADTQFSYFIEESSKEIGAIGKRDGNLFRMMFKHEMFEKCNLSISIKQWHEKLAHQNIRYVRDVLKKNDIKYIDDWDNYVCPGCVYGKQHRMSHPRNLEVAKEKLDLIHVDICEMNLRSLGGAKYFLLLKDDYSHFRTVYFLKTKDEAYECLNVFTKLVENQFDRKIKKFRSDHGTEIKNAGTKKIFENLGIFHTKSNYYSPEQNGRIEREMRTVVEAARSAIHTRNLNENLWAEAVSYAVFTLNQTGTSTVKGKSPAELWFGRTMDVKTLRIFGCDCYVLIPERYRTKSGRKSKKGIFVGYDIDSASYRIYLSKTNEVVSSENVIFDENSDADEPTYIEIRNAAQKEPNQNEILSDSNDDSSSYETISSEESGGEENEQSQQERQVVPVQTEGRSLRNRGNLKKPARLADFELDYSDSEEEMAVAMITHAEEIPIVDALKDKNWKQAMQDEYQSLVKMETWKLVEIPKGQKALTCRWVLCQKQDGRFKARLVARGFEQQQGIDYNETFSPVARHASVRLLLSIAASEGMNIMTFDVKTAFLNGNLDETIYMYQPEGFDDGTGRVCKLLKSIYGLKQSSKNWNNKFTEYLKKLNFECTDDDPCVYYNKDRSILIALFVDDGIITGKNQKQMIKILKKLNQEFEITYDVCSENKLNYLGMEIEITDKEITVKQSSYTKTILKKFGMEDSNDAPTPMEKGMLTNEENFKNDEPVDITRYREAIGSLLYLATISRPDICFAVNYLSRFSSKPMKSHMKMVRRVFQYLKGTVNFGISFNGNKEMIAYSDANFGGDLISCKPTTGVIIMRGGPIIWFSQKQDLVSTSTAEAEYRAAVSSMNEVCWIQRLGQELGYVNNRPVKLYVDNQSAVHMLKNATEGKMKRGKRHIEISRKWIQQHVGKIVTLEHVRSNEQLADIFTKPVEKNLFVKIRNKIIMEEC